MQCPTCHQVVPDTANVCGYCGQSLKTIYMRSKSRSQPSRFMRWVLIATSLTLFGGVCWGILIFLNWFLSQVNQQPIDLVVVTPNWTSLPQNPPQEPAPTIQLEFPTATASPTPEQAQTPMATSKAPGDCREFPDFDSRPLRSPTKGESAPIIGKSPLKWGLWFLTDWRGVYCWVYSEFVTVSGDSTSIPEITDPKFFGK
jgi:hypothetical protein